MSSNLISPASVIGPYLSGRVLVFETSCRQFESVRTGQIGPCGSVVEHSLGKGEVAGPIPAMGTIDKFRNLLYNYSMRD